MPSELQHCSVADRDLCLVVPTYNERDNLAPLMERVHGALEGIDYGILVVDDDSPDGSSEVALGLKDRYPVEVVVRRNDRGLASAVVEGFTRSTARYVAVIDADLQHPPELLRDLYQAVQTADLAIATRYGFGGTIARWNLLRRIESRFATLVAHIFLPAARVTSDPMSGFFMLRRDVIEGILLKPLGYKILLEILARCRPERVVGVTYAFDVRAHGRSKLGLKQQLDYVVQVVRLGLEMRWRNRGVPQTGRSIEQ